MTGSFVGALFGLVYALVDAGDLPSAAVLLLAGSWWGASRDLRVPGSSGRNSPDQAGSPHVRPDRTGAAGTLVWAGTAPSHER